MVIFYSLRKTSKNCRKNGYIYEIIGLINFDSVKDNCSDIKFLLNTYINPF